MGFTINQTYLGVEHYFNKTIEASTIMPEASKILYKIKEGGWVFRVI